MEIRYGDTGWEELNTLWEKEGAAAQFERVEVEANQRWSVMQQPGDIYPRFLLIAAQVGTENGNERPVEWLPRSGYTIENNKSGVLFRRTGKGLRIGKRMPPKDESTVTF